MLRFSVFLFLPCFFNLLARLFFVTLVLETIFKLQRLGFLLINQTTGKILTSCPNVKSILSIVLFQTIFLPTSFAKIPKSIVLAVGEQREIKINAMGRFVNSSKQVISAKYLDKDQIFLIKANKQGLGHIYLWPKNSKKGIKMAVYVLSNIQKIKAERLRSLLQDIGLNPTLNGVNVVAEGEITSLSHYKALKKIENEEKGQFVNLATISNNLQKIILKEVYLSLFNIGAIAPICNFKLTQLSCQIDKSNFLPKDILNDMKKNYYVHFVKNDLMNKKNYFVRIKILQLEKNTGEQFGFGLHQVIGNLGEIFESGPKGILSKNKIALNNFDLNLEMLAEPELLMVVGHKSDISLGSEVPYQFINNGVVTTSWKFAGLKFSIKITKDQGHLKISYTTELSAPVGESVTGSKEKSIVYYKENKDPLLLFEIGHTVSSTEYSGIPIIEHIPILKSIFGSNNQFKKYKKIQGYIKIENQL